MVIRERKILSIIAFLFGYCILEFNSPVFAEEFLNCGNVFENAYGPYDFSNPRDRKEKYPLVRGAHFNSITERMALSGKSDKEYYRAFSSYTGTSKASKIASDIDYTLRAFPNHYRALNALSVYVKLRRGQVQTRYPLECYFKRALEFKPGDQNTKLVYGVHLYRYEKFDAALEQLKLSEKIDPNNAEIQYNLGLVYVKLGNLDLAKKYAKIAYEQGYPLQGLKNILKKIEHEQ